MGFLKNSSFHDGSHCGRAAEKRYSYRYDIVEHSRESYTCVYKAIYDEATSRLKAVDQLIDVFHENCFNTVARVMAYLTLIRCMNLPKEEDVRKLVRVVVPSLKNIIRVDGITSLKNPPIAHEIFIRTLCSSIGYTPMDTT